MTQFAQALLKHSLSSLGKVIGLDRRKTRLSLIPSAKRYGEKGRGANILSKTIRLRERTIAELTELCTTVQRIESMFKRYKTSVILDTVCISKFKELAKKAIIAMNRLTYAKYLVIPSRESLQWLGFVYERRLTGLVTKDGKNDTRIGWWFEKGYDEASRIGVYRGITEDEIESLRKEILVED
jgi:hypothetical protein